MLTARLHPLKAPPDSTRLHYYHYDVTLDGWGKVVQQSKDPEHDLARALLAMGLTGAVELRDGSSGALRSTINIARAARWTVIDGRHELRREKYRPHRTFPEARPSRRGGLN